MPWFTTNSHNKTPLTSGAICCAPSSRAANPTVQQRGRSVSPGGPASAVRLRCHLFLLLEAGRPLEVLAGAFVGQGVTAGHFGHLLLWTTWATRQAEYDHDLMYFASPPCWR